MFDALQLFPRQLLGITKRGSNNRKYRNDVPHEPEFTENLGPQISQNGPRGWLFRIGHSSKNRENLVTRGRKTADDISIRSDRRHLSYEKVACTGSSVKQWHFPHGLRVCLNLKVLIGEELDEPCLELCNILRRYAKFPGQGHWNQKNDRNLKN
jgi:hypothetical protein